VPGPDVGTQLAIERTFLAHERTTMAWVRTAASLISFGFTIYKFFQIELKSAALDGSHRLMGPRGFALTMIAVGMIGLGLASVQHRQAMKRLRAESADTPRSVSGIVAWLVLAMGVFAVALVVFEQ
jgi:inner membrane protein YidH